MSAADEIRAVLAVLKEAGVITGKVSANGWSLDFGMLPPPLADRGPDVPPLENLEEDPAKEVWAKNVKQSTKADANGG